MLKKNNWSLNNVSQEQPVRTNDIKAKIDKIQENSKCRISGKAEECKSGVMWMQQVR